ncbi:hypothetical protein NL676_034006 [Syzygium grande]|nr:hypothetical protein NL676_034006 [Syzygium grande]
MAVLDIIEPELSQHDRALELAYEVRAWAQVNTSPIPQFPTLFGPIPDSRAVLNLIGTVQTKGVKPCLAVVLKDEQVSRLIGGPIVHKVGSQFQAEDQPTG